MANDELDPSATSPVAPSSPVSPQSRPSNRRRIGWRTVVPVVALLAGLLFATSAQTSRGTDLRTRDTTDLANVVDDLNRTVEQRAQAVADLQKQVEGLTARRAPGNAQIRSLRARSDSLASTVGTQAVRGPAVTVSLDDAQRTAASLPDGFTADDIVVHQQDVQSVVNALWAGGAEAMMLQDQRVISTSAVRCVGNTLILQGRVYSPPYVVTAIGDPDRMRRTLEASPEVQFYLQFVDAAQLG